MILAQITDTHIKANGSLAYGRVDTSAFLDATIRHVNAFRPCVDAVIVTGDLTDGGRPEEYDAFRNLIRTLTVPWFIVPGNHDDRRHLLAAFADRPYLSECEEFIHYVVEDFSVRLIGLDTTAPGAPHGWLCRDRLAWLEDQLANGDGRPTLLFQHHPPFETGISHMDVQNLRNADEQFDLLSRFPQVRHVACGHVHRASETCLRGIGVSIAPNGAHSVTLDLDPNGPATFTMEPAAIRLSRIDDDGAITSHLSFIGQFDGPYRFFAEDGSLID